MNGRPHLHGLVERPAFWTPADFADAIVRAWSGQPLFHQQFVIEEVKSLDRSLRYNAKSAQAPKLGGAQVYFHREADDTAWWRAEWLKEWNR